MQAAKAAFPTGDGPATERAEVLRSSQLMEKRRAELAVGLF